MKKTIKHPLKSLISGIIIFAMIFAMLPMAISAEAEGDMNIALSSAVSGYTPKWAQEAKDPAGGYRTNKLINGVTNVGNDFYTNDYVTDSATEQEVQFTFDSAYFINSVVLYPRSNLKGFPVDFTLSIWNGTEWSVVATETDCTDVTAAKTVSFTAVDAKALKLTATKLGETENAGQYALQLAEVEIFGVASATEIITPDYNTSNVSYSSTGVAADTNEYSWLVNNGFTSTAKLVDGNYGTTHANSFSVSANQAVSNFITISFDKAYIFDEVDLYPYVSGAVQGFPVNFTVSVWNGSEWINVATETVTSETLPSVRTTPYIVDFTPTLGNAIKIDITKVNKNKFCNAFATVLGEIEVKGAATNQVISSNVSAVAVVEGECAKPSQSSYAGTSANTSWTKSLGLNNLTNGLFTGRYSSKYFANNYNDVDLYFTFNGTYAVDTVKIYPYTSSGTYKGGFPEDFTVEIWNGDSWIIVADVKDAAGSNEAMLLNFDAVSGKAARITAKKLSNVDGGTQYALQLSEVEILGKYASNAVSTPNVVLNETNVALSATVEAECPNWATNAGLGIVNLNDGKYTGTRYTSSFSTTADVEKDIYFYLDTTYALNEITIFPFESYGFPQEFNVKIWNGSDWITVGSSNDAGQVTEPMTFKFALTKANMVHIEVKKLGTSDNTSQPYSLQLREVEIWGIASDTTVGLPLIGGDNVSLDSIIYAETSSGDWAIKHQTETLNDGIITNFYSSPYSTEQATEKDIYVKFDTAYKAGSIILYPRNDEGNVGIGFPEEFTVSVWNGEEWATVASKSGCVSVSEPLEIFFTPVDCREIRINVTKLGGSDNETLPYVLQLAEIEVCCEESTENIYKYADINGDDNINANDIVSLKKALLGITADDFNSNSANLNSDSVVNILDFIAINKFFVELSSLSSREMLTYYVDSVSGNDSNDGLTEHTALKSLSAVNELKLYRGDKVLFKKGTSYEGYIVVKYSGTEKFPITYGNYGTDNALPVINGNGTTTQIATINVSNISNLIIDGLEVTNTTDDTSIYRSGINIKATRTSIENITVKNCYVHDVDSKTDISTDKANDDEHWYGGISVNAKNLSGYILNNVSIIDNTVEYCDNTGIAVGGRNETAIRSTNVLVKGNKVSKCYGDGIIMFACKGGIIEENIAANNGAYGKTDKAFAGIWVIWSDNCIIQYNEVYGQGTTADAQGFDVDGVCTNTIVQYNYSHDNYGGFLLLMNHRNGEVTVRFNVSENEKQFIRIAFIKDQTQSNFKANIYNNTYKTNDSDTDTGIIYYTGTLNDEIAREYVILTNNIFYSENQKTLLTTNPNKDYAPVVMVSTFNCYYNLSDVTLGEGDITDAPLFEVGEGVDSCKLSEASPCIGTGVLFDELADATDLWGNVYDEFAPNMGAYAGY